MTRKKNVFLDLDQTIINSESLEEFPFKEKGIRNKILKFEIYNMDDFYLTAERPHLQSFLDDLFEKYNVSVFTAASKDYMLFIIDKIILKKKDRKLDYVFFDYHCSLSKKKYEASKKLKMLFDDFNLKGYNKYNTIIIDDLKEVYLSQKDNAIRIKEFNILDDDSENDKELKYLMNRIEIKFRDLQK